MRIFNLFKRKKESVPSWDMECLEMERENNKWLQEMSDRKIQHEADKEALRMCHEYEQRFMEYKQFLSRHNVTEEEAGPFVPLILVYGPGSFIMEYGEEKSVWDSETYDSYVKNKYEQLKRESSTIKAFS